MSSFKEILLSEALKIVKKSGSITPITPQNKSIEKKIDISYFDTVKIVRTSHTKEIRNGELVPRDEGLRDAVILKTVKKAWKKGLKPNTKTIITYKNKKKKYDMIVVDWQKSQNKLILVTTIQDNNKFPGMYFSQSRKNDAKIMTENFTNTIVDDIIEISDIKDIV